MKYLRINNSITAAIVKIDHFHTHYGYNFHRHPVAAVVDAAPVAAEPIDATIPYYS